LIEEIFGRLDEWRHLPKYQLELRTAPFFAHFLPDIIADTTGTPRLGEVVPEFPILKRLVDESANKNAAVNVDYALFEPGIERVVFVELKTDDSSRRTVQDEQLARAESIAFRRVLEGLHGTLAGAQETAGDFRKYCFLLRRLEELGLAEVPEELFDYAFRDNRTGLTRCRESVEFADVSDFDFDVYFVQPNGDEKHVIDFGECADVLESSDAEGAAVFADYLRAWRRAPAQTPPDEDDFGGLSGVST